MAETLTRRVVKAISLLGSTQGLNMVCSVVRIKILSVLFGPVGVGLMGALTQASDMIGNVTQLNMRTTAVRDLAGAPQSRFAAVLTSVRRYSRLLGVLGAALMFVFAPLLSQITFPDTDYSWAYRIVAVVVLFQALQGSELVVLQATSNYKQIALSSLITAVIGLSIAVALFFTIGIEGVALSLVAYAVVAWLAAKIFSNRYRVDAAAKPSWRESLTIGRGFIALGALLTLTTLCCDAVNFVFMAFMGNHGETELGLFQAGYTMVWRYAGIFFSAFAYEFYPRLSKVAHAPGRMRVMLTHQSIVTTALLLPCSLIIIVFAPWVIRLIYSSEFLSVTPYLIWGMVGTVLRPFTATLSYSFLAGGKGGVYVLTEVLTALLGLGLNVAGYTLFGLAGLGYAMFAWMTIELLMIAGIARYNRLPVPGHRAMIITFIATAVAATVAFVVS